MATAELASATERAVLARVRTQLPKLGTGCRTIGIRSIGPPRWHGERTVHLDGTPVRIVECPSVLAVLDALASAGNDGVTVVLTDLADSELGDALLARLHRFTLLEADRYTQLSDLLGARALDPRIRGEVWLVDALIALAEAGKIPSTAGEALSMQRAIALVTEARLGIEPDLADLPDVIAAFDDTSTRTEWRRLATAELTGLVDHLAHRHGGAIGVVATLAGRYDDVLAQLLVAHVLTAAPETEPHALAAFGGFHQVRFDAPRPSREAIAEAGTAAIRYARVAPEARLRHQVRIAEAGLEELGAPQLAAHSPVLARGFVERLAAAAGSLSQLDIAALDEHQLAPDNGYRVERVRAAARLERWLETNPQADYATAADGVAHHARELSWVDRALTQVRAGDADPRVAAVLQRVEKRAASARAVLDAAFAARLAAMDSTPARALAVETFLRQVVKPLAAKQKVLLIVVDGMSGAVAGDLADEVANRRTGWTEIVPTADGGREGIIAALPTETRYSRASLLCAELRAGEQSVEKSVFPTLSFWPPGGATLVHKSGVAGKRGSDLGSELEEAVGENGPTVVAVVLNTVDDSLAKGRQAIDPAWRKDDVAGLVQLLDRAVTSGRVVLLTSDHGHVLEHGAEHRHLPGGGVRWRPDDGAPHADEVVASGPRVLLPAGRAIFAANEGVRYGARAHGYHGGATLAEAAIPLIGLLPPGTPMPVGWTEHTRGAPAWWDGSDVTPAPADVVPAAPKKKATRKPSGPVAEGLFDVDTAVLGSRGAALIASPTFQEAHSEVPANRAPSLESFRVVVDALVAVGGRMPLSHVTVVTGAAGRNPRFLVGAMRRVLNRDGFSILEFADGGRAVELNRALLDEQFPPGGQH